MLLFCIKRYRRPIANMAHFGPLLRKIGRALPIPTPLLYMFRQSTAWAYPWRKFVKNESAAYRCTVRGRIESPNAAAEINNRKQFNAEAEFQLKNYVSADCRVAEYIFINLMP